MINKFACVLCVLLSSVTFITMAQQIDQIGKKGGVTLGGGISANQVYRSDAQQGINPYAMVLAGNINTSLYGVSVPLSFAWSNNQWSYTQPFNQFTMSPSYKWVTAHLGWTTMSFSPYSLNGHSFAGVGVDVKPNTKFSISAMYGRLLIATKGDTLQGVDPQYKRMGGGFKTKYTFSFGEIGVHFFNATDETTKPVEYIDSLGIVPQDNMVLGTTFSVRPFERLSLNGEVSMSSLSNDKRISSATDFGGAATFQYAAVKTDLTYSTSIGSVGAGVEYVEPGYNTLGSYYMVNDFVSYTLNLATVLVNGKVNAAATLGVRESNLSKQSETDQQDVVTNLNVGFVPSEKVSFNLTYSNFYNYSFIRPLFDETNVHTSYELLDTLHFTQISENIALNGNWMMKDTEAQKHTLNGGVNWQQATQTQSDAVENSNSSFINGSGGYSWGLVKQDFSLGLNLNYSRNTMPDNISEAYGPILSIRKGLFNKTLLNNMSVSWNGTYVDKLKNGNVITARWGTNYTLKKQHRLNFSLAWSQRNRLIGPSVSYTTATLGYSYQFSLKKKTNNE